MPHSCKPFWRKDRQRWMVELDGKPVTLGPQPEGQHPPKKGKKGGWNPPEAILAEFRRVMDERAKGKKPEPARAGTSVVGVLDAYLEWCQKHRKKETYHSYLERIQSFTTYLKNKKLLHLTVEELRPFHVREWADSHESWSPGMKRGRMMAVQTAFNWALEEGKIERSPIIKMKKPGQGKRDTVLAVEEYQKAMKVHDPVTVSVLMGHADPSMFSRVCQHLNQDQDYMREAAGKVRPSGA